ncbi:MAG: hypothetical protein H0X57_07475 [Rubrobacter sp.]|nr:hypothetical protein [Rubrobacter sp.]MDQ3362907.1 hypothetical protein [Actinomycetota bacterium]
MSARIAAPLAWSVWALSVVFVALGLLFLFLNGSFEALLGESLGVDVVAGVTFPTVGAIIASRRPGNAVGWIFCATGLCGGAAVFTAEYAIYAHVTNPGPLPAGVISAWFGTWIWVPSVAPIATFLLLLFPHGRLLSPRWRPVAWLAAGTTAAGVGLLAVAPWESLEPGIPGKNPFEIEALGPVLLALGISVLALWSVSALLSAVSLFLSFRRSQGVERQQMKWFVYAGVLIVVVLVQPPGSPLGDVASFLQIVFTPLLPVAAGVAILRHRLYDIDIIINRTLVYGALTASLALAYFGSVVFLQYVFRALTGGGSQLAVVASTLTIAALFNPLRRRIQNFIDRRFYRRKYDARRTLEEFGAKLRDETDLEDLTGELVGVARGTVQPAHVSLWLRGPMSHEKRERDV